MPENVDGDLLAMARYQDLDDDDIIRLIREDPHQGFTQLLRCYGGRIRGYLRKRFPSLDDGQLYDALTDSMLLLAETFDPQRGSLPAWLLLLAHQQAIRLLRQRSEPAVPAGDASWLDQADGSQDPLSRLETHERLREVQQAIRRLPALERAVLEADGAAGRTVPAEELAEQLRTSEGSIYAARRRGRAKLIRRCDWVRDWLETGTSDHDKT